MQLQTWAMIERSVVCLRCGEH